MYSISKHTLLLMVALTLCAACTESVEADDDEMPDMASHHDMHLHDMSGEDAGRIEPDADAKYDLAVNEADLEPPLDMQMSEDMPSDLGMDMSGEVDMGEPSRVVIASFDRAQALQSPFPALAQVAEGATQSPDTLYLEGRLRLDPSMTDINGYYVTDLRMPALVVMCGSGVVVQDVTFDVPEEANLDDIYARPVLIDDLLKVIVRGQSEITLPLTGTLSIDPAALPDSCPLQVTPGQDVPFEILVHIKSEPLTLTTTIEEKMCDVFDEVPDSGEYAMREGLPLGAVLDIASYSNDFAWPYPSNIDREQPLNVSVVGPDSLVVSSEERLQVWPIPYTPYRLEVNNEFSFGVSPATDPMTSLNPIFYVPGFFGIPRQLRSGQSYDTWSRNMDVIIAYVGMIQTQGGQTLCAGHFPELHHPEMSVVVLSSTPDVCDVDVLKINDLDEAVHPTSVDRWYMAPELVHIKADGMCKLSYSFYMDGASEPLHVEQFEVELLQTQNLIRP